MTISPLADSLCRPPSPEGPAVPAEASRGRTVRLDRPTHAAGSVGPAPVLNGTTHPPQDRPGGLANQLAAVILVAVILTMIAFPALFRGTWSAALVKVMYWLY